jgi:hypothetical protein
MTESKVAEYTSLDVLGAGFIAAAVGLATAHEYYASIIVGVLGAACFGIKHYWE